MEDVVGAPDDTKPDPTPRPLTRIRQKEGSMNAQLHQKGTQRSEFKHSPSGTRLTGEPRSLPARTFLCALGTITGLTLAADSNWFNIRMDHSNWESIKMPQTRRSGVPLP
jgi:hypothetical protein